MTAKPKKKDTKPKKKSLKKTFVESTVQRAEKRASKAYTFFDDLELDIEHLRRDMIIRFETVHQNICILERRLTEISQSLGDIKGLLVSLEKTIPRHKIESFKEQAVELK